MTQSDDPILRLSDVEAAYDGIIVALRGVSLEVPRGSIVALLGANGAGKTTTLKAASGLLGAERGSITAGSIRFGAHAVEATSPRDLVRAGLVQVLEGRHCFPHLTVEENLVSGALVRRPSRAELRRELERVYTRFPRLRLKRNVRAGLTSGGEQQMTAIARALLTRPSLVLLDEPSMGLAPVLVAEIFDIVRNLNREEGVSVLLAEQNATMALRYADHGYILENGRVAGSGSAKELAGRADVKELYLGVTDERRRSFRAPARSKSGVSAA